MLKNITLRGGEGVITYGYQTAAVFSAWRIARRAEDPAAGWALRATVTRADARKLRARPLLFNAPRKGGYWCWPVLAVEVTGAVLVARLGPPAR